MGRIMDGLGAVLDHKQGAVARRVLDWPGDASGRGASVPLRLAGALHGLVLDGLAPRLAAAYQAGEAPADLLLQTIAAHEARILDWLDHPPQTNEIARAAALIAGAQFAQSRLERPLPMALSELGASAGLNLNFPDYELDIDGKLFGPKNSAITLAPQWSGAMPGQIALTAPLRRGVDIRPVPLAEAHRLRAYLWPDQPLRLARLDAALAHAAAHPPELEASDAADWLAGEELSRPGLLCLVYHTIAFQYFPQQTQRRITERLLQAGASATAEAPLAHLSMEADATRGSAALTLSLWDGTRRDWTLGRVDFHGRWLAWQPGTAT